MSLSRRNLLASGTAALGLAPFLASSAWASSDRKRVLRLTHLTDMHVQPESRAPQGYEASLIAAQKDSPDLIITGGDLVMDVLGADEDRAKKQWDVFLSVTKANVTRPIRHTLGNHDVWGWNNPAKYEKDPRFGKKWACDLLEMEKPYYSFDQGGWHFVVLDSTHRTAGTGYTARLDDEQFAWLQSDLAATPATTPILVVSHIPILMVCAIFDGENEKTGNWVIPGSYMHIDARRITDLFLKHPNVKLCLSGHEHQIDRIEYQGVTYFCSGAVSAGWWGGNYFQCTFGYGLVDLYDDASFDVRYQPFEWKVERKDGATQEVRAHRFR